MSLSLATRRPLRNSDLGIEAVLGVIDGGGNIARGNSDPRQCTRIGIVIGADDITLDLNGHTVDGDEVDVEISCG